MSTQFSVQPSRVSLMHEQSTNSEADYNYRANSVNLRNRSLGMKNRRTFKNPNSSSQKPGIKKLFVKKSKSRRVSHKKQSSKERRAIWTCTSRMKCGANSRRMWFPWSSWICWRKKPFRNSSRKSVKWRSNPIWSKTWSRMTCSEILITWRQIYKKTQKFWIMIKSSKNCIFSKLAK